MPMPSLEECLRDAMRKGYSEFRLRSFLSGGELSIAIDNPALGPAAASLDADVKGNELIVTKAVSEVPFRLKGGWKTEKVEMQGGRAIITVAPLKI